MLKIAQIKEELNVKSRNKAEEIKYIAQQFSNLVIRN